MSNLKQFILLLAVIALCVLMGSDWARPNEGTRDKSDATTPSDVPRVLTASYQIGDPIETMTPEDEENMRREAEAMRKSLPQSEFDKRTMVFEAMPGLSQFLFVLLTGGMVLGGGGAAIPTYFFGSRGQYIGQSISFRPAGDKAFGFAGGAVPMIVLILWFALWYLVIFPKCPPNPGEFIGAIIDFLGRFIWKSVTFSW